jgi:inner membrane protein
MSNLPRGKSQAEFKIQLSFNGNTRFSFAPLGESTTTTIESSWPHPSFKGGVLPVSKVISAEGFNATWRIPNLARNYPQSWLQGKDNSQSETYKLDSLIASVELFSPVSLYSKVSRAVKYGILFIGLTFLSFLIFEVSVASKIHIIQYAIIGISLALFYLLLISLSEHLAFIKAYAYAAGTTISIITMYTFAVLRSFSKGMFILILLSSLYTALYFILQMEDYALLAGAAVMLFVVLILMIATWNLKYDA